ncbi:superoxide dismutase family protein [Spongiimicrobium salis]|uniref:superoxide dismutase family protein n=1 Tax=Spongiimicrobium salis TaxID=1667022 RepID=UPI00374D71D4
MKKIKILTLGVLFIISYSCKQTNEEVIKFSMESKSDSNVTGEVTFTEKDGEVQMVAMLTGLTEGEHAIHIHEKADCSSADGKSTGGHWNPTFQPHAKWGAQGGYHKGDIGNFTADADGNAKIEFSTDEWCISCEDETKNIVGKGVIVHQGVDDFTSQPSGAAGKRVSCTGIIK